MGEKSTKKNVQSKKSDVQELKREIMDLRFQKASSQLQNTSLMKKKKKEVARILTALNQSNVGSTK